jgi:hypothetical protein
MMRAHLDTATIIIIATAILHIIRMGEVEPEDDDDILNFLGVVIQVSDGNKYFLCKVPINI